MPIAEIEVVLKPDEAVQPGMAKKLANELGEVLGSPEGGTWVKLYELSAGNYAENGGTEEGVYPIFIRVLKSKLPAPDEMVTEVKKITNVVAQVCGRSPENVHIIYEPEGRNRVAFGGTVVT